MTCSHRSPSHKAFNKFLGTGTCTQVDYLLQSDSFYKGKDIIFYDQLSTQDELVR